MRACWGVSEKQQPPVELSRLTEEEVPTELLGSHEQG